MALLQDQRCSGMTALTALPSIIWQMCFTTGQSLHFGRNVAWRNFMDPGRLGFYDEGALCSGVGLLRPRYAKHIGEPVFESLVATLLESSTTFQRLWNEQQTASLDPCHLTLLIHGSELFDSAPYVRSTRRSRKAPWCLFPLLMRQRRTSFIRSPHPDEAAETHLNSLSALLLIPLKLLGRITSAAHGLALGQQTYSVGSIRSRNIL